MHPPRTPHCFLLILLPPPSSTLFPYTTLFRSGEVLQDFHVARQHRVPREIIAFAQNLAQPPEARLNEAKDRSVEAPRMRQSALGIIGRQRISPAGGLVGGRSLRALLFFELRRQ